VSSRHVGEHDGPLRIAVDATGGDYAPRNVVDGALVAARHLGVGINFGGTQESIRDELRRHGDADTLNVAVVHASDTIDMRESPAAALRRKPLADSRGLTGLRSCALGLPNPRVGLLSTGQEETKGNQLSRARQIVY